MLWFYVRTWGLRVADLMQGPVYGLSTDESDRDERLMPHFHYDEVFGTVLNRFVVQAVAGYPLQDIEVMVYEGKHHSVDSKEVAFVAAGKKAFLDAVRKAKPLVLEPIISLELVVPGDAVGSVSGDITARRGQVLGTSSLPDGRLAISTLAPLAELGDYASKLKSLTGGDGSFTLEFSQYQPAPAKLQSELVAQWRPRSDDD